MKKYFFRIFLSGLLISIIIPKFIFGMDSSGTSQATKSIDDSAVKFAEFTLKAAKSAEDLIVAAKELVTSGEVCLDTISSIRFKIDLLLIIKKIIKNKAKEIVLDRILMQDFIDIQNTTEKIEKAKNIILNSRDRVARAVTEIELLIDKMRELEAQLNVSLDFNIKNINKLLIR